MKYAIAALILTTAALPAAADARSAGDAAVAGAGAQPGAADPCMLTATVRASYTTAADAEIYDIARRQCGHAHAGPADAEAAATWTRLVTGMRDRRRQQDALYGIHEIAAR